MKFEEYQVLVGRLCFGKRLPQGVYVCRGDGISLGREIDEFVAALMGTFKIDESYNVIKFRTDELKVSFLSYPDFFVQAHPALQHAITIDLLKGDVRRADYAVNLNPPILHRKETMLPPEHRRFAEFRELTEAEELEGLFDDSRTIGFRLNWERLLSSKGLTIRDHSLMPLESDWSGSSEEPAEASVADRLVVDRHKTALRRHDLSKPVKSMLEAGLLRREKTFFDYGCGHGSDVAGLRAIGFTANGWDPKHAPETPRMPAQVVNIGYVLNVVEDPAERLEALVSAWELTQEVLAVSALISRTVDTDRARLFADGVITSRNTFQKFYDQQELRQYLEDALDVTPVPLALGVFVVFRDPGLQQEFVARRRHRRVDLQQLGTRLGLGRPPERRRARSTEEFLQNGDLLQAFWKTLLELSRLPLAEEFDRYAELVEKVGGVRRALRLVLDQFGEDPYNKAQIDRKSELLVYLALANIRKPVPFKSLSPSLKADIDGFFENYKVALAKGRELLFSAGDSGEIEVACERVTIGWQDEQALYFHPSILGRLPPILQVYCGCAEAICGDLGQIDIIKLHKSSGKLTFLIYDDIENQHFPELRLRIKVNLRTGFVQVFDHSADHQVLCFKEKYFLTEHPSYEAWQEFGRQLKLAGIVDNGFIGPSRAQLDLLLARGSALAETNLEI